MKCDLRDYFISAFMEIKVVGKFEKNWLKDNLLKTPKLERTSPFPDEGHAWQKTSTAAFDEFGIAFFKTF